MLSARERDKAADRRQKEAEARDKKIAQEARQRLIWQVHELAQSWSPHNPNADHVVGVGDRGKPVWRNFGGDAESAAKEAVGTYACQLIKAGRILQEDLGVSDIRGLPRPKGIEEWIWKAGLETWNAALDEDRIRLEGHLMEVFPWPAWAPANCPLSRDDRNSLQEILTRTIPCAIELTLGERQPQPAVEEDYTKRFTKEKVGSVLPRGNANKAQEVLGVLYGKTSKTMLVDLRGDKNVWPEKTPVSTIRKAFNDWSTQLSSAKLPLEFVLYDRGDESKVRLETFV